MKMQVLGVKVLKGTVLDEELGFPPHIIEHQLAHAVKDPLGRAYSRTVHRSRSWDVSRYDITGFFSLVGQLASQQLEIVEHAGRKQTQFDELTAEAEKGIALLKERRSALISAAVTGKIDVRCLALEQEAA